MFMTSLVATAERSIARFEEIARENPRPEELLSICADAIESVVPFDAILFSAADPLTHQFSTLTHVRELPSEMCAPWMANEFRDDDVNKFRDLHRQGIGVSTLRNATSGQEWQSARYRDIYRPYGFGPELRALISDGRANWGFLTLVRGAGTPEFTEDEIAAVEQMRVPLALTLRNSYQQFPAPMPSLTQPGIITLDQTGGFVSISDSARETLMHICKAPIHAVASSVLAAAEGREVSPPEARLRTSGGTWLIARGDVIRDDEGRPIQATVVIGPAHSAQVTDVLTKAHGLTNREEAVLGHLARGKATRDIANALYISPHTVRDHVKSLFSKTGCRSRGELVFRYFGTSI